MHPSILRRLPWALAALVGVAALGLLMPNPGSFLLGVLGGMVLVAVIGVFTGSFRDLPKE